MSGHHLRVALSALRFFPADAPVTFNDSRFAALSTIVHELGFVSSLAFEQRELTTAGRALLENGDLPEGAVNDAATPYRRDGTP